MPYLVLSLSTFFWTLKKRRYRVRDLVLGQFLMAVTFPVYAKASLSAILGIKSAFVTTPKGKSLALPWRDLWPQLGLLILSFTAMVWGMNRLVYEREPLGGLSVNMVWCLYHFLILSSVIYFNMPEKEKGA